MKDFIEKLERIRDQIDQYKEERETTFFDRSEKWQESEKGENFGDKTNEIEDILSSLDEAIEGIRDF